MKQICHVGKRALAVVLAFYMMLGPVGNTVSATELPSGGEGGGSLCACPAAEGGQPVHQPGCPLYEEPEEPAEPQEEPEAPACTCGAQPDENGVTAHASDCPLYEEPEESEESEEPQEPEAPACTCGAQPDENGVTSHAPDCPLCEEPEESEESEEPQEPEAPACTCGAQPDENGVTSHASDCPLYEEPEESQEPETVPAGEAQGVQAALEALPDPAALEGRWENAPAGEIAAARALLDALSPEAMALVPAELTGKLAALEHIRDTEGDCGDLSCPWHYPADVLAEMNALDTPELLTLEDLQEDYGVEPEPRSSLFSLFSTPQTNPDTLAALKDNEDNAHTGNPDNDLNELLAFKRNISPVEVRFDIEKGKLPTQSAYIAIKAYDVDEESGEDDHVYVNGKEVGLLSGTNDTWNTTVLEVPLDLLREGANFVEMYPSTQMEDNIIGVPMTKWVVKVGWMQLILDEGSGGEEDTGSFDASVTLGQPTELEGGDVQISATVTIHQEDKNEYITEYSLLAPDGSNLDAAFGRAEETETVTLTLPGSAGPDTYTVLAVLKDPETEIIRATDRVTFEKTAEGVILRPKVSHTLEPAALTNGNVDIRFTRDDTGYTDVSISLEETPVVGDIHTVAENGGYHFTVSYTDSAGRPGAMTYTVTVDNIDRVPPEIVCETITIREGTSREDAAAAIQAAARITDDRQLSGEAPTVAFSDGMFDESGALLAGGTATITARDAAGNAGTAVCQVAVLFDPASLSIPEAEKAGDGSSFTLTSTLVSTGGRSYTETGFVWGAMEGPTLELNQGSAATAEPVAAKGGTLTAEAGGLVSGVTYYLRAYAKYQDAEGKEQVLYSDASTFGLGIPDYGAFSVTNNGNSTFTISRTGGSAGEQKVTYRTVNGSAVGGTHFDHESGTLTFAEGVTSQTVTVNEHSATAQYGSSPATAYSNADRTYQLELVRVTGGATISGTGKTATRTMGVDEARKIDRSIYSTETTTYEEKNNSWNISDNRYQGPALKEGRSGKNKSFVFSPTDAYKERAAYLNATAAGYAYRYTIGTLCESINGWEHTWVGLNYPHVNNVDQGNAGDPIPLSSAAGTAIYTASFELWAGQTLGQFSFPQDGSGKEIEGEGGDLGKPYKVNYGTDRKFNFSAGGNGNTYLLLKPGESAYVHFGACGKDHDIWRFKSMTQYVLPYDTAEPQLLGVAPIAGGAYFPGEQVTVALVFDEIVDEENSGAANLQALTITTNYGEMQYAGGADTNVLYFTGTVPENAAGSIQVTAINGAGNIKDMCDTVGTAASAGNQSTPIKVDNDKPTVTISDATTGVLPQHKATINATGAKTLQYAWTTEDTPPVAGWMDVPEGGKVETRQDGTWYLHVLATHENGRVVHQYQAFTFRQPTLKVSVSDPEVWKPSKTITVTPEDYDGDIEIQMTGPESGSFTGTGSKVVTTNGTYAFILTDDYGSIVTKTLTVGNIDPTPPTVAILGNGNTDALHEELEMLVTPGDQGGSGLAKVEYQWTDSADIPTDGPWETVVRDEDKDTYTITRKAEAGKETELYLHVRVTDGAGNVTTAVSQGYTFYTPPADYEPHTIEITQGDPEKWTKGPVTIKVTVRRDTNSGAVTVYTPLYQGGEEGLHRLADKRVSTPCPATVTENGYYTFTAIDELTGTVKEASIVVNHIDTDAPALDRLEVSPEGWAQEKTVTLVNPTDDLTPTYKENGDFLENSGSGIKTVQWKPASASDNQYKAITPTDGVYSFTVKENGTYTVRLTDEVGNQRTDSVEVTGVDTTAPTVTVSDVPEDWSSAAVTLDITAGDDESGVKQVEYVLSESATAPDTGWKVVADGRVTVSENGQWYLHVRAEDEVGNTSEPQRFGPVKVDAAEPSLTVTGGDGAAASQELSIKASGLSGVTVTVRKDNDTAEKVALEDGTGSFTVTQKGTYTFTATSAAGLDTQVTVTFHQVTFTDPQKTRDIPAQLVKAGKTAAEPTAPVKAGFTFQGWQRGGTDYDFSAKVTGDVDLTALWTLDAPAVALSADQDFPYIYNGDAVTLTADPSHEAAGATYEYAWYRDGSETPMEGQIGSTLSLTGVQESGSYTVRVTAKAGGLTASAEASLEVEITPAAVSFVVAQNQYTYDGAEKAAAVAQSAEDAAQMPQGAFTVAYRKAEAEPVAKPSQAGTYDILVTVNNPNFAFSDGTETQTVGALTIDRREVTAAWQNLRRTYGDGQATTVLLSNVAAEDGVTAQVSGAGENAGEYEVTASLTGEDAGNYRLTRGGGATLIIQRAPVSFTVSGNTAQADGSAHFADVTPSVDFDGYTVSYRQNGQDVAEPTLPGSYEIWVEITDGNYRHSGGSGGEARLVGALSIYGQAAPALYAISFQGGEGAQGDPPTLPDALAGQAITLPENPFTRAGSLFAGWEYGGALYQPGDSFLMPAGDVTFTARWVENTYAIGGIVNQGQEDGGEELVPVANAAVTLMRGAEKIDEAFTGTDGSYQFDRVAPGVYNLVVNYGGITVTRKVEIVAADVTDTRITLPAGMTNSVVRVADNIPPVVVGNLDTVFDSTDGTVYTEKDKGKVAAGATVEITFTAGKKTESAAESDLALIQGVKAPRDQLALLMDYALSKRVEDAEGTVETNESLSESSVLLEVVLFLPRDLQGKYSYSVYRVHEGEAQRIEEGPGAGEEYFTVSGDRTMLTLHVKRFSTYAVAYADQPASSGSSQDRYEDQTWEDVLQEILDSRSGDVVHLDGGRLENLPPEIMEALGENGVDLEIDWDGETIYIPAEGALTPEPGRIYYPLSELEEYYRDWQPASPALQPVPAGEAPASPLPEEAPAQEEPDAEEPSRPSEDGGVSGEEAPREEPEAQEERGVFCLIDFLTGGRTHFGCWWCWIVLLAVAALIVYKAAGRREKKEEEPPAETK